MNILLKGRGYLYPKDRARRIITVKLDLGGRYYIIDISLAQLQVYHYI